MKKAVFKKPFSDYSANKGFLSNLLTKDGYDKEKINYQLNIIKKGLKGESELNYYLTNTYKEIYCLHDVRIKNGNQKSQIDFVVITRDCIWILESKSLSGNSIVNEEGKIVRENGNCTKYPIIQAEIQANNLKEFLFNKNLINEDIEVKYKIVFTDNSQKSEVSYTSDEIKRYFIDVELISTVFEDEVEEKLSIKDIDNISNCLIRETKSIGELLIKDSDYLLKNSSNNYKNNKNNKSNFNKNTKQTANATPNSNKKRKKESSLTSVIIVMAVLFFIWFKYVSPLVDETMSILDTPTEQLASGLTEELLTEDTEEQSHEENLTAEQEALGEQRFIIKELPTPIGTSQQVEQTAEVILIANDMTKKELISVLKTNYSDNYDYAKIIVTTSKVLFDYYNYITFSKPDNLEELEKEHLIGYYVKNSCFKTIDDYGKDRIKFVQKSGSFAELYNQYINVK